MLDYAMERFMPASPANDPAKMSVQVSAGDAELDETLVTGFERVVSAFPTRIALSTAVREESYRELNTTANRLAHSLIRGGEY